MTLYDIAFMTALIFYLAAAVTFACSTVWRSQHVRGAAFVVLGIGLGSNTLAVLARGLILERWPLVNLGEFLALFAWGLALLTILLLRRPGVSAAAALASSLAAGAVGAAVLQGAAHTAVSAALQSLWLQLHVGTAVVAYGAFGLSFALAVTYLVQRRCPMRHHGLPSLQNLIHNTVRLGFFFMTLVLITGAVWAEQAWGSWWSWDPKETWALITWLVYGVYLHGLRLPRWQGRPAAWLLILGFCLTVFTLLGAGYLFPGLHQY